MTLLEIAQLITSIATLLLAFTLLLQLRTNHKDSELELTYRSLEMSLERNSNIFDNKDFRKIFSKRFSPRNKLSDEEYMALDYFWGSHFAQVSTDYRLGRAKRERQYYEFLLRFMFDNKLICKWYEDRGRDILGLTVGSNKDKRISFLQGLADDIYEEIMGKKFES